MTLTAEDLMADLTKTPSTSVLVTEKVAADKAKDAAELAAWGLCGAPDLDVDYDPYEPDYGAVSGDGRESETDHSDLRCLLVEVINVCTVIDSLFPDRKTFWEMDYEDVYAAVVKWCEENDAHYFSWGGASYGQIAMEGVGVRNAVANGKSKVVIEGLS